MIKLYVRAALEQICRLFATLRERLGRNLGPIAARAVPGPLRELNRHREQLAARAAWEAQLLEAQRQYRATHPPGTRVPMPRFLGLPWPPPPLPPNTAIPTPHEIWSEE